MKKGHSGRPRQPIFTVGQPNIILRVSGGQPVKINKHLPKYMHCFCAWCRLSRHNLCVLKQYGKGCAACKIVRQATGSILWNSMTSTSFVLTELANTMNYWGMFWYNLVFTEWRNCVSQNEVWGRGCYITLFSQNYVTKLEQLNHFADNLRSWYMVVQLNLPTTKGFRLKISMKLVYQYMVIFFKF